MNRNDSLAFPRRPTAFVACRPRVTGRLVVGALGLVLGAFATLGRAAPAAGAPADAAPPPDRVGPPRPLTPAELDAHGPRFSPDGARIVFFAGPPGKADIYVIARDGTGLTRLTEDSADDRDPTFSRTGKEILFASNRAGTYDLWRMQADGSKPRPVTALPGDESEPWASPLRYTFSAVVDSACAGPTGAPVDQYDKVVFTRRYAGREEVWFAALNGRHEGRLSPADARCHSPAYADNGLALAFACTTKAGPVVYDSPAIYDPDFAGALKALNAGGRDAEGAAGPRCEDADPSGWRSDPCLKSLPRRYASHPGQSRSAPAEGLTRPTYSANQIRLVAPHGTGAPRLQSRLRDPAATWEALPLGSAPVRAVAWSPAGSEVALETETNGKGALALAPTDFYLQEVRNLVDFPELHGRGASARLQQNRFVVRPGVEKEFFVHYEKLRYARRPPFVTADAALQAFHDEFAGLLRKAEEAAQDLLTQFSTTLAAHFAGRLGKAATPHDKFFAVYFAVAQVLLESGAAAAPDPAALFDEAEYDRPVPAAPEVVPRMAQSLGPALQRLPEALRGDVGRYVRAALAHEGVVPVRIPGEKEPLLVDFSQFAVRGHYARSGLAGYFLAMKWYSQVPLPLDRSAFDLVALFDRLQAGDPAKPQTLVRLADLWQQVDATVSAFMGRPVDVTPATLRAVLAAHPDWLKPKYRPEPVRAELERLRGPIPFRGLAGLLSGGRYPLRASLFPSRFGQDTAFFTALTHPDLEGRPWPIGLDVFAALGVPRARELALAAEGGAAHATAYAQALDDLVARRAPATAGPAPRDLYHAWLDMLKALAMPLDLPADHPMQFARTPAWHERQIFVALAGYVQLKHDAVLYAFQDMSVECDGMDFTLGFTEQPILPTPRGFVDPQPAFFGQMAALAGQSYERFNAGEVPDVTPNWQGDESETAPPDNARTFAERLQAIAAREVRGQPLRKADYTFLNGVGGLLEALFLGTRTSDAARLGADEGRLERGVTLVTDTHTNIQRGQVLQQGIGRIFNLYVAVPDTVGQRMTQGGSYSYYEFHGPMADRLTDEAWWRRIESGDVPPLPAWTTSFVEPAR